VTVIVRADLEMDCVPDCDLASLPDDLLDVRQNLSQYSFDPADMMDNVELEGQFVSSQSSQASEKLIGFIPFGDAAFVNDEDADMFGDYDCQYNASAYADSNANSLSNVGLEHGCGALEAVNTAVVADLESVISAVPVVVDYFGNNIVFDVKSEPSDAGTPSVIAYSPDSTNAFNYVLEDDLSKQLSITDDELLRLSTRDLNRRIRLMPDDEQRKLKNRRRTLKNRGYAQTCRTRRVGQRTELEADNDRLIAENEQLTKKTNLLTVECERLLREKAEHNTEEYQGEIEQLRASVGFLSTERERLLLEGARVRAERDEFKNRLDALLKCLSSNGIVLEEVTLQ